MHDAEASQRLASARGVNLRRCIAVSSLAAVGVIAWTARTSQLWLALVVVSAMVWALLPQAIDSLLGRWHVSAPAPSDTGSVTLAVHLKDEPAEISRASIVAAAACAPTVVITTNALAVESLALTSVPVFIATTIEMAMNQAAGSIDTDAVLILSARSFANVPAAQLAAGGIARGSSWVVGRSRTFNDDGFAPLVREELRHQLRISARSAGLELWEPNATVVSTRLIRDQPFEAGRPWGTSMRSWAAVGAHGAQYDLVLAMSAEPTNVQSYWPVSIGRRRGAVADVADAFRSRHGHQRLLALGLLLRELIGYPLTVGLLTPWLLTRADQFPFRLPLWAVLLLWLPTTTLSWYLERNAYGIRPRPLEDALALAFDAPASVLALPAALSRRVTPTRLPIPGRPLMAAAFLFAAITLVPLLTRGPTSQRAPAVGLALTELALLWLLAMRAVFQRNWAYRTYRIRCRLPVRVGGIPATTFDVSPTGLSFEVQGDYQPTGIETPLRIELDDDTVLAGSCTLVDRRPRSDSDIWGAVLHVDAAENGRWIAQLARAAKSISTGETSPATRRKEPARWIARILIAATIAVSAVVVATLFLTLVGYRPLIVSSGSMKPALDVGDLVFVERVEAGQLAVGDIATIEASGDETLTHRVRSVSAVDGLVTITTRGDANPTDETFALSEHEMTGRVVGHVPRIGALVAWAGRANARRGAVIGVTAYLVIALLTITRRRNINGP